MTVVVARNFEGVRTRRQFLVPFALNTRGVRGQALPEKFDIYGLGNFSVNKYEVNCSV